MVRNLLPKRLENLIDQGAKLGFATRSALRKAAKTAIKGKYDKHVKDAMLIIGLGYFASAGGSQTTKAPNERSAGALGEARARARRV